MTYTSQLQQSYKKGVPWVNGVSTSTSTHFDVASRFDGDLIIAIHNKTGAYVHGILEYSTEFDVMTKRGATYEVLSAPKK